MEAQINKLTYITPLNSEYEINNEYPKSIEEFKPILKDAALNKDEINSFYERHFIDYFSNQRNQYIIYHPIYDGLKKKRKGFVILSRGIDEKVNNMNMDSLFEYNWLSKIKAYNKQRFSFNSLDSIKIRNYKKFNFLDALFGKKDYIVHYQFNKK
jgi:hypothetical protein